MNTEDQSPSVRPEDVAAGMRVTFAVAAVLVVVAIALAVGGSLELGLERIMSECSGGGGRGEPGPAGRR